VDEILAAIESLMREQELGLVHIIARDGDLQKLVAVWPMITHRRNRVRKRLWPKPDPLTKYGLREWIWRCYDMDLGHAVKEVRVLLGPTFPAADKINAGVKCMAIFPEGKVHPIAERIVAHESLLILNSVGIRSATERNTTGRGTAPADKEAEK